MMISTSVRNGLLTNFLMAILLYCMNIFIQMTQDDQIRLYGIMTLSVITYVALCGFVWKWNTVRTWSFYTVFLPLFLTSCFDVLCSFDTWRSPNGLFLKSFVDAPDPHLNNVFQSHFVFLDGTIFQATNLIALHRLSKGLSARSLLLLPAMSFFLVMSTYIICTVTSRIPLHPLTVAAVFSPATFFYVVLLPLGVLKMPRSFSLSQKKGTGIESKLLRFATLPLLLAAGSVFAAKALVFSGVRNGYLDIVRFNDPLIFLNDVEKTIPFISVAIGHYVLVCLPLLAISFLYHFKPTKPTFLWEVAVINFAFILTGQFIFIGGSFYWKTPVNLRVSPCNGIFWMINLIPVAAAAMQVASLLPYRSPLVSAEAKSKKTK